MSPEQRDELDEYLARSIVHIAEQPETHWKPIANKKGVTVSLLKQPLSRLSWSGSLDPDDVEYDGKSLVIIKSKGVLNFPVKHIDTFLQNTIPSFQAIDDMLQHMESLAQLDHHRHILYSLFKFPFPCAPRDFCFYKSHVTCGNCIVHFSRSVTCPLDKTTEGSVRGVIASSGFILYPDGPRTVVEYIVQVDPCGWIPQSLVEMTASKQGLKILALATALSKVY